jgi:hypothetical protein
VTDVHYHDYKDFGGTTFPNTVEIERPRENYDIVLNMVKLDINKKLTDDQFVLEQPPGADLVRLDQANTSEVRTADRPSK